MDLPGQNRFRLDVQGLRGISVLLVVLFHAGLGFPGGFIGVDVFFVISGFVIGRGLLAEADRNGRVDLRQFYARRVKRILPALGVMILCTTILCVIVLAPAFPQPNALKTGLAAVFSVSNLLLWIKGDGYFSPLEEGNPFVHTWSLGVEEQFYIAFPLFVSGSGFLGKRLRPERGSTSTFVIAALVVSVVSLVCSIVWTSGSTVFSEIVPQAERFAFYGPISRVWEFLLGALVASWSSRRLSSAAARTVGSRLIAVGGLGLILLASLTFGDDAKFPGWIVAVPVVGAASVIASGGVGLLEHPVLTWFGDRSYSWYLWHWPAIVLAPVVFPSVPSITVIAATASLIPAMLSYRYVEQRFRHQREAATPTVPRVAFAFFVIPAVVIVAGLFGASRFWGLEPHPELAEPSLSQTFGCYQAATAIDQCTFRTGEPVRGTIMLVGDSHADVISDAVVEEGNGLGYDVIIQTHNSCAFVTQALPRVSNAKVPDCLQRQISTLANIERIEPDVLVVANNSPYALREIYADSPATKLFFWEEAIRTTITDVEPHVDGIVVYSVAPYFEPAAFDLALPSIIRPDGNMPVVAIDELQRSRGPILAAEDRGLADAQVPVVVVDPLPLLCGIDDCVLRSDDGKFRWRDPDHLANVVARQLGEPIRNAVSAVLE